jgi:hypothetical protein
MLKTSSIGLNTIQDSYALDCNRKMITVTEIGLEDPKELTMLSIGCNFLHKKREL